MKSVGIFLSAVTLLTATLWFQNGSVFIERILTYPYSHEITETDWYQPQSILSVASKSSVLSRKKREDLESVFADMEHYASERESLALLISLNGNIVKEWYQSPFSSVSKFNSMSMLKTLVSLLAAEAEQRSMLSLSDRVSKYLKIQGETEKLDALRVIDLMRMTSGVRVSDSQKNPFSDLVRLHFSDNMDSLLFKIPVVHSPGENFEYNNVNTQWLAAILEHVSGVRLGYLLREWLFQPLGVTEASLWLDHQEGREHAYCCLFMTAESWMKVAELLKNDGNWNGERVLSSKSIEQVKAPSPVTSEYAHGVWLRPKGSKYLLDLFSLEGARGQYLYIIPELKASILRVGDHIRDWDRNYLPNRLISALKNSDS